MCFTISQLRSRPELKLYCDPYTCSVFKVNAGKIELADVDGIH